MYSNGHQITRKFFRVEFFIPFVSPFLGSDGRVHSHITVTLCRLFKLFVRPIPSVLPPDYNTSVRYKLSPGGVYNMSKGREEDITNIELKLELSHKPSNPTLSVDKQLFCRQGRRRKTYFVLANNKKILTITGRQETRH